MYKYIYLYTYIYTGKPPPGSRNQCLTGQLALWLLVNGLLAHWMLHFPSSYGVYACLYIYKYIYIYT